MMPPEEELHVEVHHDQEVATGATRTLTENNSVPIWTCLENLLLVVSAKKFKDDWDRVVKTMTKYNSTYPLEFYTVSKCKFQLKKILDTIGQENNVGNANRAGTSSENSNSISVAETHLMKQVARILVNGEEPDPRQEVDYLYHAKHIERLEDMDQEITPEELTQIALETSDDDSESESQDEAINDMRMLRRNIKSQEESKRAQDAQSKLPAVPLDSLDVFGNSVGLDDNREIQASTNSDCSVVEKSTELEAEEALETTCVPGSRMQSDSPVSPSVETMTSVNILTPPITHPLPSQCNHNQLDGINKQKSEPVPTVSSPKTVLSVMEDNSSKLEDWKADLDKVCLPAKCEYFDSNDIDSIQATFVPDSDIIPQVEAADLMTNDPVIISQEMLTPIPTSPKSKSEPARSVPEFKIPEVPVSKKTSSPVMEPPAKAIVQSSNVIDKSQQKVQENGIKENSTSPNNGNILVTKPSPPAKRSRSKVKIQKSSKKLKLETNGCGLESAANNYGRAKKPAELRLDPEFQAFRKSINLIHDRIMTHKHANLFKEPVRENAVPGYSKVVLNPICMKSIKRNIETGVIRTTEMYQYQICQMFFNAIMFSPGDNRLREIAVSMAGDCVKILEEFKATQDLIKLKKNNAEAAECAGLTVNEKEDCLPGRSTRCERTKLSK